MKYTLVADTHLYSKYELKGARGKVLNLPPSDTTCFVGDIVDISCCNRKDLDLAKTTLSILQARHQHNWADGNHDAMGVEPEFFTIRGVMFIHYDILANAKRWSKYRADNKQGAGLFKKLFVMSFIKLFDELDNGMPKDDFFDRAVAFAKAHGCHTIVGGHFHPESVIEVKRDGVRVIILPQGITELEL